MRKFLIIIGFVALFLLLVLAGVGGWAYYQFLYTPPLTQQELDEMRVDWDAVTRGNWSPWWDAGDGERVWNPAASYNAWLAGVPEEDKAWPAMLEAYYAHKAIFDNEHLGAMPTSPAEWEKLVPVLASAEADAALDEVLRAFERPVLGAWWSGTDMEPYEHAAMAAYAEANPEPREGERAVYHPGSMTFDPDANTAMIEVMLPALGRQRNFTNFVRSKASYELEMGDAETFVRAMEGVLAASGRCNELPTLIGVLVETAVESVCVRTIGWGLAKHRDLFDGAQLARLDRALAAHADARYVWEGEAMMVNDTLRRLSDDRGALKLDLVATLDSGMFASGTLGEPVSLPLDELHASAQRAILVDVKVLRSASSLADVPWDGNSADSWAIFEGERGKLNFITARFLDIMLPALENAALRIRQHTQEVIGLRVGIAVHRHLERHGAFPESLDAIDDDLLTLDPVDVFTGNPLGYALTEDGAVVYSLGPDRVDNGGAQGWDTKTAWDGSEYRVKKRIEWWSAQQASANAGDASLQWDWVLFPMPEDELEPPEPYDPDWDLKQDGMFNEESGAKNAPEDGEEEAVEEPSEGEG